MTDVELSHSGAPVLEETYRELRLPLLRLAFLLTGSRETAEDLVQSAFASAQPRWRDIEDPPAYLRRSVVNLAKDTQRREFRRRGLLRPEPEAVTSIPEIDETWALVRRLPATQRAVVVLHYYEDLPLVEIARLLQRPASTVRSDLRRALTQLRGPAMTAPVDRGPELDEHLRRTLAAVAATVHEAAPAAVSVPVTPAAPRSRLRRRLLIAAGVTIAAVPLAAAAVVRFGSEYVDRIPPANPIVSGSLDGERYWVVDGREIPRCKGLPSGIELIAEQDNLVGREWDTVGAFFGPPTRDGCAPRSAAVPPEYTYDSDGGVRVGDGMLWLGALHPDVDQVRVSLAGGEPFDAKTFEHEGGTYYVLEVPPGTRTFRVDYLVDGEVLRPLSGERATHVVPTG